MSCCCCAALLSTIVSAQDNLDPCAEIEVGAVRPSGTLILPDLDTKDMLQHVWWLRSGRHGLDARRLHF